LVVAERLMRLYALSHIASTFDEHRGKPIALGGQAAGGWQRELSWTCRVLLMGSGCYAAFWQSYFMSLPWWQEALLLGNLTLLSVLWRVGATAATMSSWRLGGSSHHLELGKRALRALFSTSCGLVSCRPRLLPVCWRSWQPCAASASLAACHHSAGRGWAPERPCAPLAGPTLFPPPPSPNLALQVTSVYSGHQASQVPCAQLQASDTDLAASLHVFLVFMLPLAIRWAGQHMQPAQGLAAAAAAAPQRMMIPPPASCPLSRHCLCPSQPFPSSHPDAHLARVLSSSHRRWLPFRYQCEYRAKLAFIWPHLSAQQRAQYPGQLLSEAWPLVRLGLRAAVLFFMLGLSSVLGLVAAAWITLQACA
jgi:hypothetical protein